MNLMPPWHGNLVYHGKPITFHNVVEITKKLLLLNETSMKSSLIILFAAGSLTLGSCANNGENTTSDTKDSSSSTTMTADTSAGMKSTTNNDATANVPQPARTNFESRYPQANNVKWSRYEPTSVSVSDSDWNYDWMSKMDTSDYQVNFNWEGMDYTAWYDNGEWIGSTARMTDNSKLPKAVNDAIHEKYADYTIKEVDKGNDKNRTVYEVELEKGSDKMKVHFDENGKAVKTKGKVNGQKVKSKDDTK